MLGGGHGWLQGQYGLLTDNILSARVVLADGTAVTASPTVNSDLFWAIRGAGHNFGVVTSVEYRIFDVEPGQGRVWAYEEYVFKQDKLEALFEWANGLLQGDEGSPQPVELTHYGHFEFRPEVDSENVSTLTLFVLGRKCVLQTAHTDSSRNEKPVIVFWLIWQGRGTVPPVYTDRARALLPVSIRADTTDITGMNAVAGAAYGTPACAKGSNSATMFGVSLRKWNIAGLRAMLDIYKTLPPELRNSFVLLEAYATRGVEAVPDDETAYPDRFNQILAAPTMYYALGNATLDNIAADFGARMRRALWDGSGQPLHAYVNYAHGDESLEALYGYEDWRLWRLRMLKAKYDPFGKFGYYAPITPIKPGIQDMVEGRAH
jgi:FAD/FMN-containing dehydrogenase